MKIKVLWHVMNSLPSSSIVLSWFNLSWQLSTTQLLTQSPQDGWGGDKDSLINQINNSINIVMKWKITRKGIKPKKDK